MWENQRHHWMKKIKDPEAKEMQDVMDDYQDVKVQEQIEGRTRASGASEEAVVGDVHVARLVQRGDLGQRPAPEQPAADGNDRRTRASGASEGERILPMNDRLICQQGGDQRTVATRSATGESCHFKQSRN